MAFVNNVTRFLDGKRVTYSVHTYDYEAGIHSAVAVADAIGAPRQQVFKSLVALSKTPGQKPTLAVIPGPETLNLKKLAQAMGVKKMQMASRREAEKLTGMLAGGISPLALVNRGFAIYLDRRAQPFDRIYVSAGKRGVQIEIGVNDLVRLTGARWVDLA